MHVPGLFHLLTHELRVMGDEFPLKRTLGICKWLFIRGKSIYSGACHYGYPAKDATDLRETDDWRKVTRCDIIASLTDMPITDHADRMSLQSTDHSEKAGLSLYLNGSVN